MGRRRQQGLSMVELMVATTLGLLITAAVLQIFLSAKRSYEFQKEFSRMQETGRFAIELMSQDLRAAGYFGCLTKEYLTDSSVIHYGLKGPTDAFSPGNSVSGAEGSGLNPDSINISRLDGDGVPVFSFAGTQIKVPNDLDLEVGDVVFLGNCSEGEIFQVTGVQPDSSNNNFDEMTRTKAAPKVDPGNADGKFQSYSSPADLRINLPKRISYYIATGASGEPALMRSENGVAAELVDGVENMQLVYGEQTADGLVYVPIDEVGSTESVVSIKLALLMRSRSDGLLTESQTVSYAGTSVPTVADRRLRKVFETTLTLRNRLD